ncbi:MAG: hypothetical protein RJP96_14760 [Algiphilus sp.]|uniref:hypothetical protein n=1 Tax=Algiphilus sp. TaxID=1872431 RepID=UPI0032EF84FC
MASKRNKDGLVTVKVTDPRHRHRRKPVAAGSIIRTSAAAADMLQKAGRGYRTNDPPSAEPAPESVPVAQPAAEQGGDATSDEGGEDDEDPASTGAGEPFAGETEALEVPDFLRGGGA